MYIILWVPLLELIKTAPDISDVRSGGGVADSIGNSSGLFVWGGAGMGGSAEVIVGVGTA